MKELAKARNISNAITEGTPGYCNGAESKKAMCQLKTFDIVKARTRLDRWLAGAATCADAAELFTMRIGQ